MSNKDKFTLQRHTHSGIFYVHWTEPTARGQRGRSRRITTHTTDQGEAERFRARLLLTGGLRERPVTKCPFCLARTELFLTAESICTETPAPQSGEAAKRLKPTATTATLAHLWFIYDERHIKRNVASPATAAQTWKNLSQHFGALKVSEVSQDTVDRYEDKRRRGAIGRPSASSTVRRELAALQACLNWCLKRTVLKECELPSFDLPPDSEPRDRWLRPDEVQKLKVAATLISRRIDKSGRMGRGERFLWLALETGARCEAICQLTWDRVDWQTRTIDFNVPGRKRTKKRRAVVPISKALEAPLHRMQAGPSTP